jgi:hypothetical protein
MSAENQKFCAWRVTLCAYGPAKQPHSGKCVSTVPCVLFITFESPVDAVPVTDKAN